jgi:hypothetical protein
MLTQSMTVISGVIRIDGNGKMRRRQRIVQQSLAELLQDVKSALDRCISNPAPDFIVVPRFCLGTPDNAGVTK